MGKILIVDDSEVMRLKLKSIIENSEHEVAAMAENGKEGIEKYKECSPDLVIMDIEMPEINGIEALKQIREFDSNSKVIMCSSLEQKKNVLPALQLGALNFIIKPFSDNRVLQCINNIIK